MKGCIRNVKICSPVGEIALANDQIKFLEIENGAVFFENGVITKVCENTEDLNLGDYKVFDGAGKLLTPGLVDGHTHLVFGGWRDNEVPLKLAGVEYLEILKQGGGILSTVRSTRAASKKELQEKATISLDKMLRLGVTTLEAKSGYGLSLLEELKQLEVARDLHETHSIDIISTFMGAHAVPEIYKDDKDAYIDLVCGEMIPAVAEKKLASFVDVFCEDSVFSVEASRKILKAGMAYNLPAKIHADEINPIGGSELAGALKAITAEHLIAIEASGIDALAKNGVIAMLLPATSFYLGAPYAPARTMIKAGIPVAIATDYNPGSCPSLNIQLVMNLAYLRYKMTPHEILAAVTLNAACGIDKGSEIGSIEVGKLADFVLWEANDLNMLVYRLGENQVKTVFKKGSVQVIN